MCTAAARGATPGLQGAVTIQNGGLSLPSLGVRYGNIRVTRGFVADSMVIDTLHLASGEGSLDITGDARFPELAKPSLDLHAVANDFLAADMSAVPDDARHRQCHAER